MSENRRIRKPMMEKKRRARINDSLDTLKQILLDNRRFLTRNLTADQLQQFSAQQVQLKTMKLEKADILEMTVNYLRVLHQQIEGGPCENSVSSTSENTSTTGEHNKCSIEDKENCSPRLGNYSHCRNEFTRSGRSAFKVIQKRSANLSSSQEAGRAHWRPW